MPTADIGLRVVIGTLMFTGLVTTALALPLIWRKIPPNPLYGLRVAATLADRDVWYEANTRTGLELAAVGIAIIALSAPLYWVPADYRLPALLADWMVITALFWVVTIRGSHTANRLLAKHTTTSPNR